MPRQTTKNRFAGANFRAYEMRLASAPARLMCTPAQPATGAKCTQLWGVLWLLLLAMGTATAAASPEEEDLVQRMRAGGHVLLIRHAEAPGTGDPAGFRLGDCSTQRNLSGVGREQARAIGAWLRNRGVGRARVYSSQWCRCRETAELLGLGPVRELPALNSFYGRSQDREPNLAALRDFLAAQPPQGELLVLVTHQVTIAALTGDATASGHGVLMALGEGGVLEKAGDTGFGDQ